MRNYLLGAATALLLAFAVTGFARSTLFSDIQSSAWYANAVSSLADIGVIAGYPDGSFQPEKPVNRAEVAQMLFRMKEYVDARVDKPNPPSNGAACTTLTPPAQNREIHVSNIDELKSAFSEANKAGNVTITLENGTYTLSESLWMWKENIFIRSASGNRDAVIVRGQGMDGAVDSVFHVAGDNVTVADITVGYVKNHPIQVHGESDADNVRIHNVHVVDGFEQLLKGSFDSTRPTLGADNGIVECSLFNYTAGIGPQYYINGIDVHNGKNWIVRDNVFQNIISPQDDLADHVIQFKSNSENTLVERNIFINNDRAIAFVLAAAGHVGGTIRDNVIYHDNTRGDVGILLENSRNTQIYNNRIYSENDYANAIEYRFSGTTGAQIHDNITNRAIVSREGGTGTVTNNITNANKDWFVNPAAGDFTLTAAGKAATGKAR